MAGKKRFRASEKPPLIAENMRYISIVGPLWSSLPAAEFRCRKPGWQRNGSGILPPAPCADRQSSSLSLSHDKSYSRILILSHSPRSINHRNRRLGREGPLTTTLAPLAGRGRDPPSGRVRGRQVMDASRFSGKSGVPLRREEAPHPDPLPASGAREKNLRCCCASLADGLPDALAGGGHVELFHPERLQCIHDRDHYRRQ